MADVRKIAKEILTKLTPSEVTQLADYLEFANSLKSAPAKAEKPSAPVEDDDDLDNDDEDDDLDDDEDDEPEPPKKAPAKRTPAKKAPAKKAPARRASKPADDDEDDDDDF